mmetsp:Transcript_85629/g.247164  ORF Transcript_85629/g.247164 Transcript_85629/m.247164 type:complete len:209 (+) Transcript_85629:147-773(+)
MSPGTAGKKTHRRGGENMASRVLRKSVSVVSRVARVSTSATTEAPLLASRRQPEARTVREVHEHPGASAARLISSDAKTCAKRRRRRLKRGRRWSRSASASGEENATERPGRRSRSLWRFARGDNNMPNAIEAEASSGTTGRLHLLDCSLALAGPGFFWHHRHGAREECPHSVHAGGGALGLGGLGRFRPSGLARALGVVGGRGGLPG